MKTARSEILELAGQPWLLRASGHPFVVRPGGAGDLAAVANLHTRCSARALLGRYRSGGRAPSVAAIDAALREEGTYVVVAPDGSVVAIGAITPDLRHRSHCAEVGVLVEDGWYRLGIGSTLIRHLSGAAHAAGYREFIAYPGIQMAAAQRLMIDVGRTRLVPEPELHLHTHLHESCELWLGAVRRRLAG